MPSPTSSSSTSSVGQTTSPGINSLIAGDKWGGVTGTGVTLAYSFPWTSSGTATFFGRNGIGDYSSLNEQNATYHYGLSTAQQAAARSALQSWANVANIVFSEVAETSLNVGDIRFAWTSAADTTSTGSQAWGWTYLPNSYLPSSGDVWISTANSKTATNSWAIGSSNFMALVHELGHALGLKHSFEGNPVLPGAQESQQYTVMSYTDHPHSLFVRVTPNADGSNSWNSFNVEPDTPMLYDVAAMQYLYGANLSYKTGNDVYTFDPGTPFIRTIWDAGGTDTISVSNFSKGSVVDLRPGHFSKITIESDSTSGFNWLSPPPIPSYDGTDNLAIAFGSIIENAIGGSGNDTLIGNDANNSLDGGGGNDTLYGGAGNDTFDWDASRRGGNDVFYGGTGDDVYVLDSSLDSVIEYSGEGTDMVWVVFSYSVSNLPNIENILAFGSTGVNLTGNAANNVIAGANGDDGITGGPGDDQIDGKGGVDTAYFDAIRSSYTITYSNLVYTLVSARDGTDTLTSVEYFSFLGVTVLASSVDLSPPTVATFSPSDEATGVGTTTNVVVTFSEAIQRGSGNIVLKTATGTTVATFDSASSANLSFSGTTLTINPTADLAYNTDYKVEFASGTIKDLAGNSYAGTTSYNFNTLARPVNLTGTSANESFTGGPGSDTLDGGLGIDTAVFSGNRAAATFYMIATGYTVSGATDGSDTLTGIERLQFADKKVALDLGVGEAAGNTVRIIGAAFGASNIQQRPDWVGTGLNLFDAGMSLEAVSNLVVPILGLSNTAFVNTVYRNVFGVLPSAADRGYYVELLQGSGGSMTQAQLLEIAANADVNAVKINLVGLQQNGVEFI